MRREKPSSPMRPYTSASLNPDSLRTYFSTSHSLLLNFLQRQPGRLLLGLLLRLARGQAQHLAADHDLHAEYLSVIGARFTGHAVFRQWPAERLQSLLQ